jgi:hypothetical protein
MWLENAGRVELEEVVEQAAQPNSAARRTKVN